MDARVMLAKMLKKAAVKLENNEHKEREILQIRLLSRNLGTIPDSRRLHNLSLKQLRKLRVELQCDLLRVELGEFI